MRERAKSQVSTLCGGQSATCYSVSELACSPGRSVLPNRSVRYFGTLSNSVPEEVSIVRFLEKLGTELLQFRYFRFGTGKYRTYRTACDIRQEAAQGRRKGERALSSRGRGERAPSRGKWAPSSLAVRRSSPRAPSSRGRGAEEGARGRPRRVAHLRARGWRRRHG